ncbi:MULTISPECIES: Hpt domain-containing protein [Brevundimonas]|uniref:Hpt domain-containing protein n=1 Tax=Brevundimonas TaxID=41275 RepID=UPI000F031B8B|nr:Hpt domain-containing protein [Brevundimonas lutea]
MTTADPLAALRARFAAKAADEAALLRQYRGGEMSTREAEQAVHALAGAAGLFGFAVVSDLARALDARFAAGDPPMPGDVTPLIEALDLLGRDYS